MNVKEKELLEKLVGAMILMHDPLRHLGEKLKEARTLEDINKIGEFVEKAINTSSGNFTRILDQLKKLRVE